MNATTGKNILAEIRAGSRYTQEQLAAMLGILQPALARLESRSTLPRDREARHILMNLAKSIPARDRSVELQSWLEAVEIEFEKRPLGGVFL